MKLSITCLLLSIGIHACTLTKLTAAQASDPNDPVAAAVDTVTAALFDEVQPAVNAAASILPPEAQSLAQAAYVALEKAVTAATNTTIESIPEGSDVDAALDVIRDLIKVTGILHAAIHVPDAEPAQAPNTITAPVQPSMTAP